MPASRLSLADTYRLLTRVCAPLAVTLTDAEFPPPGDAAHPEDAPAPAVPRVPLAEPADRGSSGTAPAAGTAGRPDTATDAVLVADAVADPGAVRALVAGEAGRVRVLRGVDPRPDVAASRFLHHYLWSVGLLFTGPWFLDRRVPVIPLSAIRIAPRTGALTLDVRTAADGANPSAADLRAAVAAHVAPVLAAFAPHVRRGPRALWGMATDDLASGLWFLGRALGEEDRGVRAATELLPGGTPPFPGAADFRVLRGPTGRTHHTRTRLGCCLHYTLTPDDPCLTCPRLPDPDRLRSLERL